MSQKAVTITEPFSQEDGSVRKFGRSIARGSRRAATAVIDTDLRDVGHGLRHAGQTIKGKLPKRSEKVVLVHQCDDPSCPHNGAVQSS